MEITQPNKSKKRKIDKYLYYFSFLTSFPIIVFIFNIGFYIFPLIWIQLIKHTRISKFNILTYLSILFALGAFLSTLYSIDLNKSLVVLPNYLYWSFLIIIFVGYSHFINFDFIYKGIIPGFILLNIYYWVFEVTLKIEISGFKQIGENGYAILLVCYSPLVACYFKQTKSNLVLILFIISITILSFLSGSRAGSILVFLGITLTLFGNKLTILNTLTFGILGFGFYYLIINSQIIGNLIYYLNTQTYDLIYNTNEVATEDQSYLLRKLMVEKGLIIFESNPFTGIGLNNWIEYDVKFRGNFEGADRILNKARLEKFGAHNSYISFLGEGGLFLLISYISLLLCIIYKLFMIINRLNLNQKAVFFGILMMAIHTYFISAMLNSFTWYLLAIGAGISNINTLKKINFK